MGDLHVMTAAIPTIWTPRAGPWWRLPRWLDVIVHATAGKTGRNATGRIQRNATGKAYRRSTAFPECGCCDLVEECASCQPGTTPRSITLTFTDVVICTGCVATAPSSFNVIGGTINGTWDMPHVVPCLYELLTTAIDGDFHAASTDCTGASTKIRTRISVNIFAFVGVVVRLESIPGAVLGELFAGVGSTPFIPDCLTEMPGSATNGHTACGSNRGHSGSVAITYNP
jgi:hypothetical protein